MASGKKKNTGYDVAVSGIKGILRILFTVFLILLLVLICRRCYTIGYELFNEEPVDSGEGRNIQVTVEDDMSVRDIGKMLKSKGVINEDVDVFVLQELLSSYHGKLLPGTYTLNTSMTTDEIFPILAQEDKSGLVSDSSNSTADSSSSSSSSGQPSE